MGVRVGRALLLLKVYSKVAKIVLQRVTKMLGSLQRVTKFYISRYRNFNAKIYGTLLPVNKLNWYCSMLFYCPLLVFGLSLRYKKGVQFLSWVYGRDNNLEKLVYM